MCWCKECKEIKGCKCEEYKECKKKKQRMQRKLNTKELIFLNCGVGENSWESLGLEGHPISPF